MHSPSLSTSSSFSSNEDDAIEMTGLQEVIVTPNPALHDHQRYAAFDDDEEAGLESSERALLNPQANPQWGGENGASVWTQARGIALETLPTLMFTTVGTIFTGEFLEQVSHWKAMTTINELIMIIPVMLNLKGNLEMNLSARLGTASNIGELDTPSTRRSIVLGNLALLQVQAAVVSFVAACFSFLLGAVIPDEPTATIEARAPRPSKSTNPGHLNSQFNEFLMVASSAMTATCFSAAILGSFMCALIILCRKLGRDPDNIAPPVAACLGDLITLLLFGFCSSVLIKFVSAPVVPIITISLVIAGATACGLAVRRNKQVKHLLTQGWVPLFGAMVITSGSGIVLDMFVSRYEGYALLAISFGGLPGGTGSILISRLSTALHASAGAHAPASSTASLLPPKEHDTLQENASSTVVILTLLSVAFPVEILFLATVWLLGWLETPFGFFVLALLFLSIAVAISLFAARFITHFLWRRRLDPDIHALPGHSALMDLSGQLLLVSCFECARLLGLKVSATKYNHGRRTMRRTAR